MPKQSTETLVPISDIREGLVVLKNGSLLMILEVSAINFELKSADEQIAILQSFQNFLNSVDFPLQIVVSSRELNMDNYLKMVDQVAESTGNELMKIQAYEYSRFIKELFSLSNIMSKKIYIIIQFYVYEAPKITGLVQSLKGMFKSKEISKELTEKQLGTYKGQLLQRAELVYGGLAGLGLQIRTLEDNELKNLYYQLYNPSK